MRRRLDRGHILVVLEKLHLLRGRNVQHVHAPPGLAREPHQALGTGERGDIIAPERVRTRVALDAQMFAFVHPVFVLGMERGATPDDLEDVAHTLIILDQQRASG
jgi:hypothetical protein